MMAGAKINTRIDQETVEEVEFHIEMREKEYLERGLSPEEARRSALQHFGAPTAVERELRRAKKPRGRRGMYAAIALTVLVLAGLTLYLSGVLAPWYQAVTGEYPELAPWDGVRWDGEVPTVRVDGRWYLVADIQRIPAAEVVDYCQETWPDRWKKRFEEDLYEAMTRMGHRPPRKVNLVLVDPANGEETLLGSVPMTEENRRAIWRAADGGGPR